MDFDTSNYDPKTGLPKDKSYLEKGLPPYLVTFIEAMVKSWEILDSGKTDSRWDAHWCDLNSEICAAEREQKISSEQSKYLRHKYLRLAEEEEEL